MKKSELKQIIKEAITEAATPAQEFSVMKDEIFAFEKRLTIFISYTKQQGGSFRKIAKLLGTADKSLAEVRSVMHDMFKTGQIK